jgi:hypothetical protein
MPSHFNTDIIIYGSEGEGDTFNEWYENYAKSAAKDLNLYTVSEKKWYSQLTIHSARRSRIISLISMSFKPPNNTLELLPTNGH